MIKKIESVECNCCKKLIDASKTDHYVIVDCTVRMGEKHSVKIEDYVFCSSCFAREHKFVSTVFAEEYYKEAYKEEEPNKSWVHKLFFG